MFRVYFSRSSCPEVFCKKLALENFAQENTCVRVSFLLRPVWWPTGAVAKFKNRN